MAESEKFDASKVVDQLKKDRMLALGVGGAAATVVGLFLPWYSVSIFGISRSVSPGLNSTGILLLLCAVAAAGAALNVMNQEKKMMTTVGLIAGVVALLIVFSNYPDSGLGSYVKTGIGFWLTAAGAVAMTVHAAMKMKNSKASGSNS